MDEQSLAWVQKFEQDVIRPAIHPRRHPLEVSAYHVRGEPVPVAAALGGDYVPVQVGDSWGAMWDTTWFRMQAEIPREWEHGTVAALLHLGGDAEVGFSAEGLIWSPSGTPLQGLHHEHRQYLVTEQAVPGDQVEFFVEAAANPIPPWGCDRWPLLTPDYTGDPLYKLGQAELSLVDRRVEQLDFDVQVLLEMVEQLPDRAEEILDLLCATLATVDPDQVGASAGEAASKLARAFGLQSSSPFLLTATGHAHIDSAWLWPVRETKRKCARTFSNQLRLMELYPEHRFACSSAAQYQWIKDDYPALYDQIRARVREGRWEPIGGMWVEPDTNVPSGESLVRQFVYGKRFFAEEFGVETAEMWIPDVFGYSAALPQIAQQAGVDVLVTQKLSWNDTNVFPHSTFWWQGHDGSRVMTHFPPANTYNGNFSIRQLAESQGNYKDHDRFDRGLYPFGFGDGGGGPTARMLETARRAQDQAGLPRVEIGSVGSFLDRLRAEQPDLATWTGELYLETHRATLTTHADVKRNNRRAEESLRAAEMWSVAAGTDRRPELDQAWKDLLLQQFHDILPGSSIHWVYQDAAAAHSEIRATADGVVSEAQAALAGSGGEAVAFNASSYDRTEVVEVDKQLRVVSVPACGWAPAAASSHSFDPVAAGDGWMDNGLLRVTWNESGLLTSIWDHEAGREVLAEGRKGNVFQLLADNPRQYDAWDIERSAFDEVTDLTDIDLITVGQSDPLRCSVRFTRSFGRSSISQLMSLDAGSRRLTFDTEVDWHEDHLFLKVAFPVSVHASRATYEIQHGHIERPTVTNTSWDEARFEVCGHRWADLSEPGYGVALLNDSKYGYDIKGNVMRLSLLKAPGYPDPEADRGVHHFAYALLPHVGDLRSPGSVVEQAEWFNLPVAIVPGSAGAAGRIVRVDRPGVSVEAVKWADRSDGVVVRLCEVWGSRGSAKVSLDRPFSTVSRTDLLEREVSPLEHSAGTVELQLRPYELVTLLFR